MTAVLTIRLVLCVVVAATISGCGASSSPELGATMPKQLAGQAVSRTTLTGDAALQGTDAVTKSLRDTVARVGKTAADVTVARVVAERNLVLALRVNGADANSLSDTWEAVFLETIPRARSAAITLGGKAVRQLIVVGGATRVYLYPHGDTVYLIGSAEDSVVAEALQALP